MIFFLQDRGYTVTAVCVLTRGDVEEKRRDINTRNGFCNRVLKSWRGRDGVDFNLFHSKYLLFWEVRNWGSLPFSA